MGAQGTAIIDFGSRATDTLIEVPGQVEILAGSLAEAWAAFVTPIYRVKRNTKWLS